MEKDWTYIITPKRKWLDIDLKELWRYRDLFIAYIRRDYIAAYKQTVLGPLWYIIQPLFTMVIYMFIFGDIAKISTDGVPQPLFYFSGIMLWNYFSSSFSLTSHVFVLNSYVFGKVFFPRLIIPLANVTSNLLKLCIQFVMFTMLYAYFMIKGADININWTIVLLPFLIFLLAMHSLTWGLIFSTITYKYRDLEKVIEYGIQLFMYVTPVVYPLNITTHTFRALIELNPLTPVFEFFRYAFMSCGSAQWWDLGYSFVTLLFLFIVSVVIFNRTERTFMDTV